MSTDQKTCFKCHKTKPLTEFYRHSEMADGHLNKCKSCTKHDVREHRRNPKFREKVLEYDRNRGSRQTPEQIERWRNRRPLVKKAHTAVGNAVRDGRLEKPTVCSHCHKSGYVHGHHEDYTKPLEVVWLCVTCHRDLHSFYDTVGHVIPGSEVADDAA